jgi:hypothetical protein
MHEIPCIVVASTNPIPIPIPIHMKSEHKAETAYVLAYNQASEALEAIHQMIHDLPAPEGEIAIDWSHVAEMARIAAQLKDLLPEEEN